MVVFVFVYVSDFYYFWIKIIYNNMMGFSKRGFLNEIIYFKILEFFFLIVILIFVMVMVLEIEYFFFVVFIVKGFVF